MRVAQFVSDGRNKKAIADLERIDQPPHSDGRTSKSRRNIGKRSFNASLKKPSARADAKAH